MILFGYSPLKPVLLGEQGLLFATEPKNQGREYRIVLPGNGDTSYDNALNVRRTVDGFAKAGYAAIMIAGQLAPKRIGHKVGKEVAAREEAFD